MTGGLRTNVTSQKCVTIPVAVFLTLVAPAPAITGDFCKWTDENGVVHYAEECPDDVKAAIVSTQDELSESQISAAEEHSKSLVPEPSQFGGSTGLSQKYRSMPKEKLGPLPPNNATEFLKTTGANYRLNSQTLQGNLVLFLEAAENVPAGAWVEAAFPDPSNIEQFELVGRKIGPNQKFMLESSPTRDLKCWNYLVEVRIFSNSSKENLIGIHRQAIQSHVNLDLVKNTDDLVLGVTAGLCVRKDRKDIGGMSVDELEALCQAEREKRLAPQRERLIQACVKNQGKSREYCEMFYADYGDATRIDRARMRPALYMDLPECVAAREERERER